MASRSLLLLVCLNICTLAGGHSINVVENESKSGSRRLMNCVGEECDDEPSRSLVYLNGKVYTVDTSTNWDETPAQAIVIEDEQIAFVGSTEDAKKLIIPGLSKVYDLRDNVVLPGFHDVHIHPLEAMSPIGGACQLPSLTRPDSDAFDDELSVCPSYRKGTEWVLGAGHSITPMLDYVNENSQNSPKKLLDSYIADRPAAMLEETSHSAWVNSMALELAGINNTTLERPGGVIMREPNGSYEPNGILFENEAISIFEIAMDPKDNNAADRLNYEGLLDAFGVLAEHGITSLCDARVFWRIQHDAIWEKACNDSELSARAILGLWAYPEESDDYQIETLKELYTDGNEHCSLRKSQIKVYMDGIIQSTTAAMREEYLINLSLPVISEQNVGLNYFDKMRLENYLRELQDFGNGEGFDFNIHAIGDRGIREALDAIKAAKASLTSRTPRHRLTHLEVLDTNDIARFNDLDVIADFQVAGDFTLPSEHDSLAEFIGMDKATFSIPVKRVVDTGAVATFSSDWDVSTVNPFVGIQHSAQRGNQSVSIKTAIEMYTANPAYAMRQENTVGMLMKGMDADIVIIDKDILNIDVSEINSTKVLHTIFMGEIIYKRNDNGIQAFFASHAPSTGINGLVIFVQTIICFYVVLVVQYYLVSFPML